MLPNWLYGKSKSKLASILGGGGSIPEDYNQVKAQVTQNAEDILLLSDALDDKAGLTQISNPNILHNPWFNVNQRGVTSVTASNGFIADRWRVYTTLATFEVTRNSSGHIVIDNTSGDAIITVFQKRTSTYINSLHGKKVTASVMFSDGTIKSGSITFDSTQSGTYYSDDDYALNYNPTSGSILAIVVKAGKTATVKALKLEVGEVSTLAMDPRPEYAVELAKCQRYFQRISNSGTIGKFINVGLAQVSTYLRMGLPYIQKRTTPTITITGTLDAGTAGPYDTLISLTSSGSPTVGPEATYFLFTATGLTEKQVYNIYLGANSYIDIDAEL